VNVAGRSGFDSLCDNFEQRYRGEMNTTVQCHLSVFNADASLLRRHALVFVVDKPCSSSVRGKKKPKLVVSLFGRDATHNQNAKRRTSASYFQPRLPVSKPLAFDASLLEKKKVFEAHIDANDKGWVPPFWLTNPFL